MPKPNYSYEKRQKDLAKKKKQDEKRARRLDRTRSDAPSGSDDAPQTPRPPGEPGGE
ncbi:MAG TPA: hypothetical protein VK610_06005 [Rhodothermales bacterium]|nr:hypothetical protein [Rhodothermales bacterium]